MDRFIGLQPSPEGTIQLMSCVGLDTEYAKTVDLSKPIIVVRIADGDSESVVVVDGWHRIYRARIENRDTLPALLVAPETGLAARVEK